MKEQQEGWHRTDFCSIWAGPDIDLIVLQAAGPSEAWDWSARGYRELDDGWKREVSRERAEREALKFYLEKE